MNSGRRWGGLASGVRALGLGLLLRAGLACAVLGLYAALGWFSLQGVQGVPEGFGRGNRFGRQVGWQALQSLLEVAFLCLLALGWLRRVLPLPVAALMASLVFGLIHLWNPHATVLTCLNVAVVVGLPACAVFAWTHSYWGAFGFHFAWNLTLGPVFGVIVAGYARFGLPESSLSGPAVWTGGLYGPEGGLFSLVLNGTLAAWLPWRADRSPA